MQRLIHQEQEQRERGASAIIVALTMLVLIGFAGLGVDVTSAYAKSQEVQNAADAAALGAAQECAQGKVDCAPATPERVQDRAEWLAGENVRSSVDGVVVTPAENRVSVKVTAEHENFFAAVFGIKSFTVVREATAQWNHAGLAALPVTFSACSFYNQAGEPGYNTPVTIYMPSPNNGNGNSPQPAGCPNRTYPPGGFGWLDETSDCAAVIREVGGGYEAGSSPGNSAPKCVRENISTLLGEMILLPIFTAKTGQGNNAIYYFEQFAAFELTGYEIQTGNLNGGDACGPTPAPKNAYTKTCLVGRFVDWVEVGADYSSGPPEDDGVLVRLIDPDHDYNS